MEMISTITEGFSHYWHHATCLANIISFAAMKIFGVILTKVEVSRV